MKTEISPRELLLALNATATLSRAAICRLGEELDAWTAPRTPSADRPAAVRRLAAAMGIPWAQMEHARALLRPDGGGPAVALSLAATELARAERLNVRAVTLRDPEYPAALRQLPLPPPVLFLKGTLPAGPAISIVGSRRADPYGLEAAELFGKALAEAGVVVVSGFARGVDAAAHRGALAAREGVTVAVLGCGLGVDYPRGHRRLGEEVAARGALVTEFPCGVTPRGWHFPVRNRIIAALGAGTLVVQAAARSGSLSTARHALDLGREVFAIPGRIFDERSLGPNALIKDGAALVQHPREILDQLSPADRRRIGWAPAEPGARAARRPALSEVSAEVSSDDAGASAPIAEPGRPLPPGPMGAMGPMGTVLGTLAGGAQQTPEEIAERAGLPFDQVLGHLLELELSGRVRRYPGPTYGRME